VKVGIVGIGHVGLPTAAALASLGHEVVATDTDREKVELLASGGVPFFEPGLDELIHHGIRQGNLRFTEDPAEVTSDARIVFICVGTPPRASGEANLLAIERAAEAVARQATGDLVIAEKSTVPAGTAQRLATALKRHNPNVRFFIVSNPEFLREGRGVEDSLEPARILVGSDADEAFEVMKELYAPLIESGAVWIQTDLQTAELAKHASNAFLSLKISFINAVAQICERAGADVVAVADAMGADPRIGRAFLNAGMGYGGYCFPKDLAAFERLSNRLGYDFSLLREIARINDAAIDSVLSKVEEALWNLEEKRIALLGLAFKPGTDDVRFAPALELARRLLSAGASVVGYDPQAGANAKGELPELEVVGDVYAALDKAHCAVLCTEWDDFRRLDLAKAYGLMTFPVLVDGRNLFDPADVAAAGFTYLPTGRPRAGPTDS
jgi:UDPglucose 6-dehydrogenase